MTSIAIPEQLRAELRQSVAGRSRWEIAEHVAVVVLLMWWAVPFTRAIGGRGVHNELLFTIVVGVVLLAVRGWRTPAGSVGFAAVVAICAVLVCVFAPTGWYGSDVAAGYVLAAGVYVAGRRYVHDEDRAHLVAAAVCLAGVYQFSLAFQPWWGGRDPAREMSGTFYWHNPYAAFLLPGAVIGLGFVAEGRRPWNLVGWVSVPLCVAGIVFSSSRATLAAVIAGIVLVGIGSARVRGGLKRAGGAVLLAVAVVAALPGWPLFPSYDAPWAATTARTGSGQSLATNGHYRTEFWRAAIQDAIHHPVVGTGYHALASDAPFYTPSNWARSPLAHNGFLQAFSDGGLLLGLPVLLAALVVAGWALRRVWTFARARGAAQPDVVAFAVAVAFLGVLAHVNVDFDWSHPSIRVETVLLAVCLAPAASDLALRRRLWRFGPFVALLGVLAVFIPVLHQWQIDQPSTTESATSLLAQAAAPFGDYRPAKTVLSVWELDPRTADRAQLREALAQTSAAAKVDLDLALLRFAVGARSGLIPNAVAAANAQVDRVDGSHGPWVADLALVYLGAGDRSAARDLLAADVAAQVAAHAASPALLSELSMWAHDLGAGSGYACELRTTRDLVSGAERAGLPSPTASCPRDHQGNS
ncbi:MAG TPA: O-antigen ligase family protein [Mycobacteriales bacterium]|nr:O-antigen ligase family protein [Mycobacteriales bacterium]